MIFRDDSSSSSSSSEGENQEEEDQNMIAFDMLPQSKYIPPTYLPCRKPSGRVIRQDRR